MSDEYHLRINGNAWYGWTAMRISAGIDRLARDFEVQVTKRASEKGELLDAVSTGIKQGDRVEVLIGRNLVLTGYVDARPVSYDARSITRSIRGRSRTGDLIDSAATVRQFRGQTPQQIAALTVAEMEYSGHSITAADQREIQRSVTDDIARRKRFGEMMRAPAYQWKKPAPRR